jgi:effector-binding domain-containing protein
MKRMAYFLIAVLACFGARAEDDSSTTKMRVKQVAARTFLCTKETLKIEDVPAFIRRTITPLVEASTDLKIGNAGPPLMSYLGYRGDASQPFTAELAIPARAAAENYKGPFYFRSAGPFKCASVIYQGPVTKVGEAWMALVTQATEAGLKPKGDSREVYLWWEGEDSQNNVIELQLGLE